uniref:LIM and calponin homology domains 1 n=1 Tax=Leptobrachium leishanense TaxID=445787 RepID=A0A8C5PKF3_9ANUR
MASPAALALGELPQDSPPDSACKEAQKWIEQVTGRSFGDKDFRTGLENGILLCELLNAIKPGLVKKINRLPTPIAGLDNITLFLRGCKELGLKESQLFDPGDLQDTSNRTTVRASDCNRKLRNVLVTVYWLGKTANSCISYSGNQLDLKEFEGLLAQMRKENEELESPKRSIRDSGYVDCWDSERSDSLSPPRHGRDDSFDSLDSFGSRSQQTPSPDVVLRGSSDGRGSDSESDLPHRRLPDVRKDDMSARRVSFGENKAFVPFNQYLPNKSNPTTYIPAPLRKKKAEREDYRKSWSTATSPLGGERPFSPKLSGTPEEEQNGAGGMDRQSQMALKRSPRKRSKLKVELEQREDDAEEMLLPMTRYVSKAIEEVEKLKSIEQAGIQVLPASSRYSSQKQTTEDGENEIALRKENHFQTCSEAPGADSEEEEEECRVPDLERDDLATRKARMNQPKTPPSFNQYVYGSYLNKTKQNQPKKKPDVSKSPLTQSPVDKSHLEKKDQKLEKVIFTRNENTVTNLANEDSDLEEERIPDVLRDDLAKRKTQSAKAKQKEPLAFAASAISKSDLETWQRLKVSSEDSEHPVAELSTDRDQISKIDIARATNDDFGRRKLSLQEKRVRNKQKFVHFGPVTEIDQQRWDRLCIAKADASPEAGMEITEKVVKVEVVKIVPLPSTQILKDVESTNVIAGGNTVLSLDAASAPGEFIKEPDSSKALEKGDGGHVPDIQRDDMLARRTGAFQKLTRLDQTSSICHYPQTDHHFEDKCLEKDVCEEKCDRSPEKKQKLSDSPSEDLKSKTSDSANVQANKKESVSLKDEDQEGVCVSESDVNSAVVEKDDLMARRLTLSQKQSVVGLPHFLPIPFAAQENEKPLSSCRKELKPLSFPPLDNIVPKMTADTPTATAMPDAPPEPFNSYAHPEFKDELAGPPQVCDPFESLSAVNPFCAEISPHLQETGENADQQEVLRFSPQAAPSEESMSMCDMRYEEEGGMLPHSRAHQDHLQTINDQLKEEDETWQDDLAKWKTRRRSTSQDLIKRDQERKKMERLLSGEGSDSERRKSIKTYKEIVEEKERRERELHEAYKNAKTKEEAEKILQKYIERFTISEAVLERIVMPKILERSSSVEPSLLASSEEPNPLKYLRQQSLPSPKYTSTVEATISPSSESDHKIVSGQISPSKNVISKAVPMLTAKPYSQPKTTQEVLKTFKVDGRSSLNGEACNGMEDQKVGGCGNLAFAPPLTRSQLFEGKARVDDMSTVKKQDIACIELSLTKTDMQDSVRQMKDFTGTVNHDGHRDELTPDVKTEVQSVQQCLEGTENPVTINQVRSSISSLEFTPLIPLKEIAVNGKVSEKERQIPVDCDSKEQNKSALVPLKDTNEPTKTSQLNLTITIRNSCRCSQIFYPSGGTGYNRVSPAVTPTLTSPSRFCAWDPEEERRRQERWQQEQEKRLQERYQKEQEKLKEEWEKAQKEVEEEERKYYEEEKKIIEDTVMPLTVPPVASGHLSVPEKNGSLGSAEKKDGNQEKNAGKDCIELQESSKDCVQTGEIRKPQTLSWKQEETNHRAEEAIKRLETDEWVIVEKESEQQNHVPLNECNPAAKSNLQADRQVTSPEIHLPVDETSPSSFLDGRTSPMITRGSVSGKKLCSTCGHPLGKGAAMIIETLSLYFHIQCFKCGICKGQLGDATTGTDVRIRNGLLNCNDCYVRSRTAGHPTPL